MEVGGGALKNFCLKQSLSNLHNTILKVSKGVCQDFEENQLRVVDLQRGTLL